MQSSESMPTTRSRSESGSDLLDVEKHMLTMLAQGDSLRLVLEFFCRGVEALAGSGALASVLLADGDRLRHGAAPSLPAAFNEAINGIAIGPSVGSCGAAAFTGQTVITEDIHHDARWAPFLELATAHGLRACWAVPVLAEARILATVALYYREARAPSADDLRLVERGALMVRAAIERHAADTERAVLLARAERSQHQAEAEREALRAFIRNAPGALCLLRGPTHIFEFANPAYMRLVGDRPQLGLAAREAFPELAGQGFFELLDGVYASGEAFIGTELPAKLQDAPGVYRDIFVNFVYQPTRDAAGTIDGIAVYAHEVTEFVESRKAIAQALEREQEQRLAAESAQALFRALFDSMPQLGWTARPDGFIEFYNAGWYEYTGTTFEEMQGWGWRTVHDPDLLDAVIARWQHSLDTGTPFEMEFPLRRHDGVFRMFLTRINPLRDTSGQVVRWVGVNTDIEDVRAARALSDAVAEQSREAQRVLLQMRSEKEAAERQLAALLRGKD